MSKSPILRRATEMIKRIQLDNFLLYCIFEAANMRPEGQFYQSEHVMDTHEEVDARSNIDQIRVNGHSGIEWVVAVLEKNNVISFHTDFSFHEDLSRNEKLEFLNQLNLANVMARFSMSDSGDMGIVDYELPIGEGITPLQILNCAARFDRIVERAIADEYDGKVSIDWMMHPEQRYAENEYGDNDSRKTDPSSETFTFTSEYKEMV